MEFSTKVKVRFVDLALIIIVAMLLMLGAFHRSRKGNNPCIGCPRLIPTIIKQRRYNSLVKQNSYLKAELDPWTLRKLGELKKWMLNKIKLTWEKNTVFHCKEWWTDSLFMLFPGYSQLVDQQYHFIECMWRFSGDGCVANFYLHTWILPSTEKVQISTSS